MLQNPTSETADQVGEFQSIRGAFRSKPNQGSGKRDLLTCKFCLRKHPFGREKCPAWRQKCRDCDNLNHFATSSVCRGTENNNSSNKGQEERNHLAGELFLESVEAESTKVNRVKSGSDNNWEIYLRVKDGKIKFKIDTEAEVTVIGTHQLKKFGIQTCELQRANKSLIGPDHKYMAKLDANSGYC